MPIVHLDIEGMSCVNCARGIERSLLAVKGARKAAVSFAASQADVETEEGVEEPALAHAVEHAGYRVRPKGGHQHEGDSLAFFAALAFTVPLLLPMLGIAIAGWAQLVCASIVQFGPGWRFYRGAFYSLRAGSANMDLLIALGISAAYGLSLYSLVYGGHLYFESSTLIVTLVLLGRWLESFSRRRASEAIHKLMALQPATAFVKRNGKFVETEVGTIQTAEIFQVRAGDRVPVDGVVTAGRSTLDESLLTGESLPVEKGVNDKIFGGTINGSGVVEARASQVGERTVLSGIIRLVAQAQQSKAPVQKLADLISSYSVPAVVLISVLTFTIWWLTGSGITQAVTNAVSVLVIACPCALGHATPIVIMAANGRGAEMGVLFKEAAAIEQTAKLQTLVIDKTGTLTEGRPRVLGAEVKGDISQHRLLAIASTLEERSTHPLAAAIVDYSRHYSVEPLAGADFYTLAGKGVSGEIEGTRYFAGSVRYAQELSVPVPDAGEHSLVALWKQGELLGTITVADPIRMDSRAAVEQINAMGIKTLMLTGDNARTASVVASQTGIRDFEAEVLPEGKAAKVAACGAYTGMVGDGINDAPALAAASVGFAIGAGSDIAIEAADVTLVDSSLFAVVRALKLSRAAFRKIRQNLFFAFAFNVLAIPLAAAGLLNPAIAAGAMSLSSFLVVSNAVLLKRWKPG